MWRRYLADGDNLKFIFTVEERNALTTSASSAASAAVANVEVSAGRFYFGPAVLNEGEIWTIGHMIEANDEKRA